MADRRIEVVNRRAVVTVSGAALIAPLVQRKVAEVTAPDREAVSADRQAIEDILNQAGEVQTGASVTFLASGDGAMVRSLQEKAGERVSITDYMSTADKAAAVAGVSPPNATAAIQAAMTYWLNRFPEDDSFYPGGSGDPTDFYDVDRQTGLIHIPAGVYYVDSEVFSSLDHDRAPYVGFRFEGDSKMSSILMLDTNGAEAWFYNNTSADPSKFQQMQWENIGFRSDNYLYGNGFKVYSEGGPKQFRWTDCDFQYLQKFLWTEGTGNADLTKVTRCTGQFYGTILTLDNDQSVQHDFLGTDFGVYGHFIHVKQHGGGNVNVVNCSMDWLWHEDYSPAGGNFLYYEDADSAVSQGNCTFAFKDCRIEVEAYKSTAGAPPFGLVKTQNVPNTSAPRILFENVNFVNGHTYAALDGSSPEYRRITAVDLYPGKHVEFRNCQLLKTFFYNVTGDRDTSSPAYGGILKFVDCADGITTELPPADSAKENLHSRVTYSGSAGRVITEGMNEHTTGSSFTRKVLDADPNWRRSFAREPASTTKIISFKHTDNGWPFADSADNDHYLDLPSSPGILALRIFISMPAAGAVTNAYQLHLKINDRSGVTVASSTLAQFKDAHIIDLSMVDLPGISRLCLCADGDGTDFRNGGYAFMQYV